MNPRCICTLKFALASSLHCRSRCDEMKARADIFLSFSKCDPTCPLLYLYCRLTELTLLMLSYYCQAGSCDLPEYQCTAL